MLIHTDKKAYVVFSLWLRIFHWTMVLSVTALFWTGLYIGDPGFAAITGHPEPTFAIDGWFSMETMRRIHFIAGCYFDILLYIPICRGACESRR